MNERIEGLWWQARIGYNNQNCDPEVLEKFAELIIQECMACSIWVGKNNTNTVEPMHTAQAINQRIKKQFGIEE
jgi:hypothetical protein